MPQTGRSRFSAEAYCRGSASALGEPSPNGERSGNQPTNVTKENQGLRTAVTVKPAAEIADTFAIRWGVAVSRCLGPLVLALSLLWTELVYAGAL